VKKRKRPKPKKAIIQVRPKSPRPRWWPRASYDTSQLAWATVTEHGYAVSEDGNLDWKLAFPAKWAERVLKEWLDERDERTWESRIIHELEEDAVG
jgi:hypothetical protein